MNVDLLTNQLIDVVPVHFLKVGVPQCHHDRHSSFELLYIVLQLLLNWVGLDHTFDSLTDLGVFLGELGDIRRINLTELGRFPISGHRVPLGERMPHQMSGS